MGLNPFEDALEQSEQDAPQPSTAPANPFLDALDASRFGSEVQLRGAVKTGHATAPDQMAEAVRLSQRTGIPVDVVNRNFSDIKKRAAIADTPYTRMLEETPHLAEWAKAPENASVAQDDLPQLGALEFLFSAPQRAVAQGINQVRFAQLKTEGMFRQLTQAEQDLLGSYKHGMELGGDLGAGDAWWRKSVVGAGQLLPNLAGGLGMAAKYGSAGAVVAAPFGLPAGPGGALTAAGYGAKAGAFYGGAKFGFELEAGLALDEFEQMTDETGQKLDPSVARMAALGAGALNAGLEAYGLKKFAETIPGLKALVSTGTRGLVRKALQKQTVRQALLDAARSYGGALTAETATEVAQRAGTILAGELAKEASGQDFQGRTGEEVVEDLITEGVGAVQAFGLTLLPGPAIEFTHAQQAARRAQANADWFTAIGEGMTASKAAERAPEQVRALVARAVEAGPVANVYAPTDTWRTYWQSQGQDPDDVAAEITGNPHALEEAEASGQVLKIPTENYATRIAPTEHNAFFAEELKLAPDEMNTREAKAFEQIEIARAQAEAAGEPAPPSGRQIVADGIRQRLEGAGYRTQDAAKVGQLLAAAIGTLTESAGLDPVEQLERYGITVERASSVVAPMPTVAAAPATTPPAGGTAGPVTGSLIDRETGEPIASTLPATIDRYSRNEPVNAMADVTAAATRYLAEDPDILNAAAELSRRDAQRRAQKAAQGSGDPLTADTGAGEDRADGESGTTAGGGRADDGGERAGTDGGRDDEGRGDGARAQRRRLPSPVDLAAIDAERAYQPASPDADTARLTPEVVREVARIVEELDTAPFTSATWTFDIGDKSGNAAGGNAERTAGGAGAPVYQDVLQFAPLNKGKKKADALAAQVRGSRSQVEAAGRKVIETGRISSNLAEGIVRVAERRAADDYRFISRPILPPSWGVAATPEIVTELSDAIDAAVDVAKDKGPSSFGQALLGDLFADQADVDTLDTGEQQPRLPGAGDVREQDVATPEFEAPFALTSEVSTAKKGKQRTLFQSATPAERIPGAPNAEGVRAVFIGWQDGIPGEIPAMALYNLLGGPDDGTTVTVDNLEEREIPVPPTPRKPASYAQQRRGELTITPEGRVSITLFEQADLSTFLHESGHFFLELYGDVIAHIKTLDPAALTPAQTARLAQGDKLLQALGVESWEQISTPEHEAFAEMFEEYLRQGRAPSVELQGIFATFRAWMLAVYRNLKRIGAPLTEEVRDIFDRMLATDEQIASAEARGRLEAMFLTAEQAGMSPAQFAVYEAQVRDAGAKARELLDAKLLAEVRREQERTWKTQRAEIRQQVAEQAYQAPVYQALAAIRYAQHPDGSPLLEGMEVPPLKLSKAILVDRYGAERVARLPKPYVYTTQAGGLDPELLAERFGFTSGDELLQAIETTPPLERAIEQETNERMIRAHGSLLLDGSVVEEAQLAAANEVREGVIRAELRALWDLERKTRPAVRQARAELREEIRDLERERDYERRWLEAEAKLRIAIAEGRKQAEVDRLEAEIAELKAKARGGAATIRAAIPSAQVIAQTAQRRIAATRVKDLNPAAFWSAARKAAARATEFAARQQFSEAIDAKTQELLNLALYREAEKAKQDVEARVAKARELLTPKVRARIGLAGPTFLEQIDGILDRYNFAKISQVQLEKRARMRDWMEAQEANGLPVDELPAAVQDDLRRVDFQTVPYEELVGITDGLAQLVHLARLKNRQIKTAKGESYAATRDALVASIREKNPARPQTVEFDRDAERRLTIESIFASHTKIATLARMLDGHVDGGLMWEHIIRPLNAAATEEDRRKTEAGERYRAIVEAHYPGKAIKTLETKVFIPAINASLSKEARIAVALNWGNETSRARLLADPVRRWTEAGVEAILDTLEENDWTFVEQTWRYIDTFWPEIAAKQERVTGLRPEKVEGIPVRTKFGERQGGYYPLAYDGRLVARAQQNEVAGEAKLAAAAAYVRTTTRRGHTEARLQNVKLSVRLDLGVAFQHLDQVLHDLTHHETLIDVSRLLRDTRVSAAVLETRGSTVYQQFTRSLQDIASGSIPAKNAMDRAANFLRTRTQLALMGWNLWTAAQQPLGLFNGMERVGPKWVAKGMGRWLRDASTMQSTTQWIAERSAFMANRHDNATQDLADLRQRMQQPGGWFDNLLRSVSGDAITQQHILDSYLWHIGLMQRVADVPTWLGAYEKAMAAGEPEERAIALADQAVRDSQGSGQIVDLADVQRGGPIAKLFMTFYSYGNVVYNRTVAVVDEFKGGTSVSALLGHLSLLYIAPAIGTVTLMHLTGRSDEEPEGLFKEVAGEILATALNTMVGLREFSSAVGEGTRGYAGPAGARAIQLGYGVINQVKQGKVDEGLVKAINAAAGVLFRYPAGQVQKTVDGFVAIQEGRTANPLALLFGAPPE